MVNCNGKGKFGFWLVNFSLKHIFEKKNYELFSNVLKFDSKRHYQKLNPITLAKEYENVSKMKYFFLPFESKKSIFKTVK